MAGPAAGHPIDSVIFDIGNVIVRWDIRCLYEKLIEDPVELDWFLSHVVTPDWHFQHDAGRSFAETSAELAARFPRHAGLIHQFGPRFHETVPGQVEGVAELISRLAASDVQLFGLSNFSAEFWPSFRQRYELFDHFTDIIISGEVQLTKPDPAIYQLALARFRRSPERCLFIDDREENIAAAEAQGIAGHLFVDAARLEEQLATSGLLQDEGALR